MGSSASPYHGPGNVALGSNTQRAVIQVDDGELAIICDALGEDRQRSGVPGSHVLEQLSEDAVASTI